MDPEPRRLKVAHPWSILYGLLNDQNLRCPRRRDGTPITVLPGAPDFAPPLDSKRDLHIIYYSES